MDDTAIRIWAYEQTLKKYNNTPFLEDMFIEADRLVAWVVTGRDPALPPVKPRPVFVEKDVQLCPSNWMQA